MQQYLEEQVKFYETVKASSSDFVAHYSEKSHDSAAAVICVILCWQIAEKLRNAHRQFVTLWEHLRRLSHYRREPSSRTCSFIPCAWILLPPLNLNFTFSLLYLMFFSARVNKSGLFRTQPLKLSSLWGCFGVRNQPWWNTKHYWHAPWMHRPPTRAVRGLLFSLCCIPVVKWVRKHLQCRVSRVSTAGAALLHFL